MKTFIKTLIKNYSTTIIIYLIILFMVGIVIISIEQRKRSLERKAEKVEMSNSNLDTNYELLRSESWTMLG